MGILNDSHLRYIDDQASMIWVQSPIISYLYRLSIEGIKVYEIGYTLMTPPRGERDDTWRGKPQDPPIKSSMTPTIKIIFFCCQMLVLSIPLKKNYLRSLQSHEITVFDREA